jgi:hypothetical protein
MALVVVCGPIANKWRHGGMAWVPLSYLRGFEQLGFETFFLEQLAAEPCTDRDGNPVPFEDSAALAAFRDVTVAAGIEGRAALVHGDGPEVAGGLSGELADVVASADLVVNISGHLASEELRRASHRTAYVDLDPGYTQFWSAHGTPGHRLEGHDVYFTVGANVGVPGCPIPTEDIRWIPTRPPVVLADWPVVDAAEPSRFTTVSSWRGAFGRIVDGDRTYGLKVHEFRRFVELPQRASATFEVALDIHPADGKDLELLKQHGWEVVRPEEAVPGHAEFRRYVQGSGAEFSVAQGIYVQTSSGWFSDRSVRYLASGKPVLLQDTGLGWSLPVGEGLLAFTTLEEAVGGVRELERDHDRHARAARALAEEFFDSDVVLRRMLEDAGVSP